MDKGSPKHINNANRGKMAPGIGLIAGGAAGLIAGFIVPVSFLWLGIAGAGAGLGVGAVIYAYMLRKDA